MPVIINNGLVILERDDVSEELGTEIISALLQEISRHEVKTSNIVLSDIVIQCRFSTAPWAMPINIDPL